MDELIGRLAGGRLASRGHDVNVASDRGMDVFRTVEVASGCEDRDVYAIVRVI